MFSFNAGIFPINFAETHLQATFAKLNFMNILKLPATSFQRVSQSFQWLRINFFTAFYENKPHSTFHQPACSHSRDERAKPPQDIYKQRENQRQ